MATVLVTGGCSFTAYRGCWPYWLIWEIQKDTKKRPISLQNTGTGASDNETIARRTIHKVNSLLKDGVKPSDIFVSIMWSGANRISFYSDDILTLIGMFGVDNPLDDDSYEEVQPGQADYKPPLPYTWPADDENGRYYNVVPSSAKNDFNPLAKKWYKHFSNENISTTKTYENVLRVQWYLNNLNINYIMQTYSNGWDNQYHSNRTNNKIKSHIQIEHLREMIDWSKFTDTSCYQWVKDNTQLEWTDYDPIRKITREPGDHHPTSMQMEEYTLQYLWPTIKEKGMF